MKLRTSECGPIRISMGSVTKVAGMPPATEPSNWQKATGTFSLLSRGPSFSTSAGFTKQLVQLESSRSQGGLQSQPWEMEFFGDSHGCDWTKGSSLESVSVSPWSSSGGVRVPSVFLGEEMNSMTSTPFSAISLVRGCDLVGFLPGAWSIFLTGWLILHSTAR